MARFDAPGLPADWLNAWLAAVGVTVLLPEVRLAWTDDPVPRAVFEHDAPDELPEMLAGALPSEADLETSVLARNHPAAIRPLTQNIDRATFAERAALSRDADDLHLAALFTDLAPRPKSDVVGSAFNIGAPQGRTPHQRVLGCRRSLPDTDGLAACILASLTGLGMRSGGIGLGFDYRRVGDRAWGGSADADPVVELLAFQSLTLFPSRGDGHRRHNRGWVFDRNRSFLWCAWAPALDGSAIDSLLDVVHTEPAEAIRRIGVRACFTSVSYRSERSDPTRGLASRRLS
jgi:hypothetical protein